MQLNVQNDNNANNNAAAEDPMMGGSVAGDDEAERHSEFVAQVSACACARRVCMALTLWAAGAGVSHAVQLRSAH